MRQFWKWSGRALLLSLALIAALALWQRERLMRAWATSTLFDADRIVHNFSHMDEIFLTTPVLRGAGDVAILRPGEQMDLPEGAADWITRRNVTGLVVLRDGALVHESYYQGTEETDLRISWSIAKSFLSVLTGILVEEGAIASLDDPVTKYAPDLMTSAYEGATIRNVLQMSSGVAFDEDYLRYDSDINKMGRLLALGGSMDAFAADLTARERAPGSAWQYVSIDTHVLGMVLRGATKRSIPDLLSEKLISRLGFEHEPRYITDSHGVAFVLGGLNLTTRDYARFGQMIAQGGIWQGEEIVSADWLRESTAPSAPTQPGAIQYGYQWWVPADAHDRQEFFGRGIYGQYLYINKKTKTVIAVNATDRSFREPGVYEANLAMLRAIAAQ